MQDGNKENAQKSPDLTLTCPWKNKNEYSTQSDAIDIILILVLLSCFLFVN